MVFPMLFFLNSWRCQTASRAISAASTIPHRIRIFLCPFTQFFIPVSIPPLGSGTNSSEYFSKSKCPVMFFSHNGKSGDAIETASPASFLNQITPRLFAEFLEFVSYKLNFWSNDYLYGSFARFDNTSNTSRFDYFITDCSNIFCFKS